MEFTSLKKALLNVAHLEVETDAGTRKYKLALDFNAISKANEEFSKDFAVATAWTGIASHEAVKLCWYALKRFHPEVTWDEVCSWFQPEHIVPLQNLLFELAFPGTVERLKKAAEANTQGESQPNSQAAS
jgi:hypothetical protein